MERTSIRKGALASTENGARQNSAVRRNMVKIMH